MKLSVITVCKNVSSNIEKTLLSIIKQTYKNIEIIVIDGNSNDDTLSYLKKYKKNINHLLIESDSGIYNAMNKGLKLATGDVIYFLNAGDKFFDEHVVDKVIKKFKKSSKTNIIYGNVKTIDALSNKLSNQIYGKINKTYFFYTCFVQQAMFFKKKCFEVTGNFDESFKISGDYDWIVRSITKHNFKMEYLNEFFCIFAMGGVSNSGKYKELHEKENNRIKKHFTKFDKFFIRKLKIKPFHFFEESTEISEKIHRKIIYKLIGWGL